ncbi:MAG: DUF559 domain-containing protein [Acidobacteria bacterium]|nr:DUF559 domain-containing protein [Acidobacteriota bacterium]
MGDLVDPRGRARELRRQTTEAERKLWWCPRDRRFKGRKFRRHIAAVISEPSSSLSLATGNARKSGEAAILCAETTRCLTS